MMLMGKSYANVSAPSGSSVRAVPGWRAGSETMDAAMLKNLQAPLKEAYRETPEKA